MGIETALSAIEFNQRQDLQKEEKSRYERETRLKGPPIEIRYPSFSCPPLSFPSFCNLWRLWIARRVIVERGGAENDIFRNRGGNSRSELADRFLSRFSSIRYRLTALYCRRHKRGSICHSSSKFDEKTYFPTIDRSGI